MRNHLTGESGPAAAPFPGGVLVDSQVLALGVGSEPFLEPVIHALAHNWFGDEVFFAPDAALGMGEGLPEYATVVVEESEKGEPGRRQRIVEYLNEYDKLRSQSDETPLGVTMLTDPAGQRRIALAKAPLFFVALEDACGEVPMRSGLKYMVTLLRGQQTSYDALRSALEQSSGKNLAGLFRVWLNDKGIPADFRARYAAAAGNTRQ
jgi:aminopeptidase N